jgi:hypothetical protein
MPDQWGTRQEQTTGLDSLMTAVNNKRFDNALVWSVDPAKPIVWAPRSHSTFTPNVCDLLF